MKKISKNSLLFLLIILLTLLISGCSDKIDIDYSDQYVFGQDSQENFIKYQNQKYIAESEDSYYYLNSDNHFIYIIDKDTHRCYPLCNKSDCLHDQESSEEKLKECNAFLNTSFESLVYYNNSLYYQGISESKDKDGNSFQLNEIYKMSIDGSRKEVTFSTREYIIWNFKVHRNNIYFLASKIEDDGTSNGDNAALFRISVNGEGSPEEIIPYYEYENTYIYDSRFFGNHLFIYGEQLTGNRSEKFLFHYDLNSGKLENLSENLKINIDSMFSVFNNKLYFSNGSKIYECNFNGEEEQEIIDCKKYISGYEYYDPYTNDGSNLIISPSNLESDSEKLILLDSDYHVTVQKMPFQLRAYIGCDENGLIVYQSNEDALYFINKSDFSSEKIYTFVQP